VDKLWRITSTFFSLGRCGGSGEVIRQLRASGGSVLLKCHSVTELRFETLERLKRRHLLGFFASRKANGSGTLSPRIEFRAVDRRWSS
jgi:hypothetical protein